MRHSLHTIVILDMHQLARGPLLLQHHHRYNVSSMKASLMSIVNSIPM
jgi:hypothetical protein